MRQWRPAAAEDGNDDPAEHAGHRVAPAKPLAMTDRRSWEPVDEHLGARHGDEYGDPIAPSGPKPQVLQNLEEEGPGDRVESTRDVQLEKNMRQTKSVELPGSLLDKHEVVVDAAASNEGALIGGDKLAETRREPEGEDLGKQLGEQVDEADRSIIAKRGGVRPRKHHAPLRWALVCAGAHHQRPA